MKEKSKLNVNGFKRRGVELSIGTEWKSVFRSKIIYKELN